MFTRAGVHSEQKTLSYERTSILEKLKARVNEHLAILAAGCSAGIIARSAEEAEVDLIVVYSTGRSRMMGLPTWRSGDSNTETLGMASEILNVVESTPVVGGVEANDPRSRDLGKLLDEFVAVGFSGIINPEIDTVPAPGGTAEIFKFEVSLSPK